MRWCLHKGPHSTAFATRWGNSWRLNTIVLKGDSMSGLAGDYMSVIVFGSNPQRPHPYETRTGIGKAHHHHAILISWFDCSSCCWVWVEAICVLQPVQQCEQCMLERRRPYLTRLLTTKGGTPSGFRRSPYAFHEAALLAWESSSHFLDTLCFGYNVVYTHFNTHIHMLIYKISKTWKIPLRT